MSVVTTNGDVYTGNKVIITVPIGVLCAAPGDPCAITFSPALPAIDAAIGKMGYGAVIKVLLRFTEPFWKQPGIAKLVEKKLDNIGFIFSREAIPTWWTQHPGTLPLLTGWLGGPPAEEMRHTSDEDIRDAALSSLAAIFKTTVGDLQAQLLSWRVVNWTASPYSRGSYTFATVDTDTARKVLCTPVEDTICFAGEALYDGPEMGTVEAALSSGKSIANMLLDML